MIRFLSTGALMGSNVNAASFSALSIEPEVPIEEVPIEEVPIVVDTTIDTSTTN